MRDINMDNDNNRSSTENNSGHSSTKEAVQMSEKSCSMSDEGNPTTGLADKKQKTASAGLSQIDDQPKCLADHLKGGASGNPSAEIRLQHPDQDSQGSTAGTERTDERNEKFQKNLQKFLKEREPLKEIQLRKKTEIPRRMLKSDGEMTKINYCGDTLKLPSNLPNRSSAPPTLSNETESKEKSQTKNLFCVESSEKRIISKRIAQTSNILKKDTAGTKQPSPAKALDLKGSEISPFKVPISPNVKKTPDKSAKMLPIVSKEDSASPVQSRPTHFTMKPKKAFYSFSPGSPSGLLRCQSLPEINKPRRKDEAQRRSINSEEHSRIVRSLFRDKPEPATPESKVSTFHKSNCFLKPETTENAPEEKVPKTSQNIPSKICRKLIFGSCSKETAGESQKEEVKKIVCVAEVHKSASLEKVPQEDVPKKLQNRPSKSCRKLIFGSSSQETTDKGQQAGVPCDVESPPKRKNISPAGIRCSISLKKVRISLKTDVEESGYGDIVRKSENPVDVECSISGNKIGTCSESKTEESGRDKTELLDVGCSKSVRTSSETKVEAKESGENVRKNVSPIDVVCAISAKKVKTSSEKIVESESDENVKKPANPDDAGSSDSAKKETTL